MTLIRMSDARLNQSQAMLNTVADIYQALKVAHVALTSLRDFDLTDAERGALIDAALQRSEAVIGEIDGASNA